MFNIGENNKHRGSIFNISSRKLENLVQYILSIIERRLKLKIKGKLGIAFVGFSSIPMVVGGTILWYLNMQSMRSNAIAELSHTSEIINIRLKEFTDVIQTDLELINFNYTAMMDDIDHQDNSSKSMDLFKEQLQNLMKTKPHYYRLTFLVDSLQSQLYSFNRDLHNRNLIVQTNSYYSWNYYRLLVQDLRRDQIRITPIELLDREHSKTLAALSVALPYNTEQENLAGIFVIDIFADYFFKLIETSLSEGTHYTAGIIDHEGHYLYHSQMKSEWNRLLAEASLHTLDKEFSTEIASQIISPSTGLLETKKGDVVYHIPLEMSALGLQKKYYFYLLEPGTIIFSRLSQFGLIFLFAMVGFIIIAFYLSRIATLQFVEPIRALQRGSDKISRGNFSHRLNIESGDEIQEMADRFNYMAKSIEERDQQLQEINESLEGKISERTLELQDEKDKLRIILDNVPSAFVLLDRHQIVITASSALKQYTGYSPQDAVGKKCFEIMNTISDCEKCKKRKFNKERLIYRDEIKKINDKGNETIYERINIPVKLVSGENACLEIFSDITKRVRLQNQLLQSEKLATIGEMAAVIAHEIRNSLTSANMLLQLIQEAKVLKNPEKESMEVALSAIDRINKVTQDLLAFARPAEIQKEPTDLQTVIKKSTAMYKHHFQRKGIKLAIQSQNDLPLAHIDHKLMQDVFNNILLNSSQALEQNGSIKISIEKIPFKTEIHEKFIPVNTEINETNSEYEKPQEVVQISFQDDGPGCPSEKLTKIFDPFYTTKINGTGLGLSMSKRVVELHGGFIYAISKMGRGMQIIIILPIEVSK